MPEEAGVPEGILLFLPKRRDQELCRVFAAQVSRPRGGDGMNVMAELERLTDPGVLRRVKVYSPAEIKDLQEKGKITPIEHVHKAS